MDEGLLVLLGAMFGLVATVAAGEFQRRRQRADEGTEMLRRAVADFVSRASAARYEYERLVYSRLSNNDAARAAGIPPNFDAADLAFGYSYHYLTLLADGDTVQYALALRNHLAEFKWVAGNFSRPVTEAELDDLRQQAWSLRDECVKQTRKVLKLPPLSEVAQQ